MKLIGRVSNQGVVRRLCCLIAPHRLRVICQKAKPPMNWVAAALLTPPTSLLSWLLKSASLQQQPGSQAEKLTPMSKLLDDQERASKQASKLVVEVSKHR